MPVAAPPVSRSRPGAADEALAAAVVGSDEEVAQRRSGAEREQGCQSSREGAELHRGSFGSGPPGCAPIYPMLTGLTLLRCGNRDAVVSERRTGLVR